MDKYIFKFGQIQLSGIALLRKELRIRGLLGGLGLTAGNWSTASRRESLSLYSLPDPDDVSGLANGAMENSEYDLRKQMNRRTSHKMNLNTDFQT